MPGGGAYAVVGEYIVDFTDHQVIHHEAAVLVGAHGFDAVSRHAIAMTSLTDHASYGVKCSDPVARMSADSTFTVVQLNDPF